MERAVATFLALLLVAIAGACAKEEESSPPAASQGDNSAPAAAPKDTAEDNWAEQRRRMVEKQIQAKGVWDLRKPITNKRVIQAMLTVPRHEFVREPYRHMAYADTPLPIGEGQTISQPYIVAFMTEQLRLKRTDTVLEIGTGSGYHAAVLAHVAKHVYSIEIVESLGKWARQTLNKLGYKNVTTKIGDGYRGWAEHAPFDAVIVTCAPDHIPQPLIDQLEEGGRMIIPVGELYNQKLYLLQKRKGKVERTAVLDVAFVPMTGEAESKGPAR